MGWIKAKIAKLLHMEMASANIKNVYTPLISFSVAIIFLLVVIIIISIICGKDIIAYICLAMVIIIGIVCIVAYFIIFNKDPDLLHDEQHILEREMIKYINKEKSNKSEPSNYNEFNKY